MASKDFALPHRPQGSEDDPEGIFFTLDTYQETFISDIFVIRLQKLELIFGHTDGTEMERMDRHS